MVKKIIHLADLHLRTFRMHDEYKEILQDFMDKCKELVKEYEYGEVRIVIVGDLVHQKITISNEQLVLGCWFLKELSEIAPLIVVAGNHDLLENNKDRLDSITPMIDLINSNNIRYYKDNKCYEDENLVWCNYSVFHNNERPDIESARQTHGDDKTYIGLYHAPIIGAKTDLGYEFDEHHTSLEHFEGNDIVMLGDIHLRQVFNHKGIKIAYPSSLIQQGFGETVSNHGFLFWDVNEKDFQEFNIDTNYGYYNFEINSLDDLENNSEIHTNP